MKDWKIQCHRERNGTLFAATVMAKESQLPRGLESRQGKRLVCSGEGAGVCSVLALTCLGTPLSPKVQQESVLRVHSAENKSQDIRCDEGSLQRYTNTPGQERSV